MERSASFGYWVRRRRKALDLTQDELAQRVSCALSTIRKIEADERRPSREFAERLADLLEIAPAERAAFLKAARAELGADHLAEPAADIAAAPAATRPAHLPASPTPLVGRGRELAHTSALIRAGPARLLTLTGAGGVGKTRLALALAEQLLDAFAGVWFVALASIRDPALVISAIAQALDLKERGDQSLLDGVKSFLQGKAALLILDNFEQVTAAAPLVAQLLAAAPHLKAIVTSRERLHLAGEHEFAVPALALPPLESRVESPETTPRAHKRARLLPVDNLAQFESVDLFVQRARAAKPGFVLSDANAGAVAELCARLDGLPLAIELAAARCKLFAPPALLARLQRRLTLLTGGAHDLPIRHQTLRDTIDWSYELLDPHECGLFARLGVFVGGCTIEAAEQVLGQEVRAEGRGLSNDPQSSALGPQSSVLYDLATLVDKSLLRQEDGPDGEPRFSMLETIREYALERLEQSGEVEALRHMHASYFLALAEQAEPELTGPRQLEWLERLEREHDNLRAALAWSLGQGAAETAARLGGALWRFWYMRGHLSEGRRWLERILEQSSALAAPTCAKSLNGAGTLANVQNDYVQGQALCEEGLRIYTALGDKQGMAYAILGLTWGAIDQGKITHALYLSEQSLALFREVADTYGIAGSLNNLGNLAYAQREHSRAIALYEESLALRRARGDMYGVAASLNNLGNTLNKFGDHERAIGFLQESLELSHQNGDNYSEANTLCNIGVIAHQQGHYQRAIDFFVQSLELFCDVGNRYGIAECLEGIAGAAGAQRSYVRAARLWAAAEALRLAIRSPLAPADHLNYDRSVAAVRAALGAQAFANAWAAGRALTLEQAIDEAIHRPPTADH